MAGCRAGGWAIVGSCSASVLVCHTSTYLGDVSVPLRRFTLALESTHDSSMHATQGGIGSGLVPSLPSDRGACVSCRRGRIGKTSRNTRMIAGMLAPPHSALTLQGVSVSPDLSARWPARRWGTRKTPQPSQSLLYILDHCATRPLLASSSLFLAILLIAVVVVHLNNAKPTIPTKNHQSDTFSGLSRLIASPP